MLFRNDSSMMAADERCWWQRAVFYEIYIRSFQDSDGDGVGDLNGITSRLEYLRDLGVDALWITPFYPSPQVDFGYDISDHEAVDPAFGTIADFDRLVDSAHRLGIRIVLDVILNHTSDRHPWFRASRASRASGYRDWYIWRDGAPDGGPPNNWESAFGGPAWTYDGATGQWYYHFFYPEQPDLNWRSARVEERMLATLGFWLDRGVDGFRLDAVNTLFEDPDLRPNPPLPEPRRTLTGVYTQEFVHTRRLPEVHDVLRRVRRFVDRRAPGAVLISEAYLDAVAELVRFYGDDDEMHLPFNFFLAQVPALRAAAFRRAVEEVEHACGHGGPTLVLSNHDIARACDRYDAPPDRVAPLLATMLLTLRGTPFIYYGEELGMRTVDPERLEEVRDPVGRRFWPDYKGRDGSRRPMAWDGSRGAGFTSGTPWLALPADAERRNVDAQLADRGSILSYYRSLLRCRRDNPALLAGRYRTIECHPDVFAYAREDAAGQVLVALNLAAAPREAAIDRNGRASVLAGTRRAPGTVMACGRVDLEPFEGVVAARLA